MAIRRTLAQAATVLGLVAAAPALATTPAAGLFYERAVMTAADGACRLFAPDVATALIASKTQARGAALRSGDDAASLASVEAQASDTVSRVGCASPDLAKAAQRVRAAFSGYAHLDHLTFPGEFAPWLATRPVSLTEDAWRASQRARFGWDVMTFGLAGHGADRPLTAVASFADGAQPYGARLVLRDASATSGPFLDARLADINGHIPIDGRLAPRMSAQVFNAGEMTAAPKSLTTPDTAAAWSFHFPAAATEALAKLDPRESVAVEFLFAGDDGESVRTAYVEVGDFAAAQAFQSVPQQ
ncbi:MAG TPA: hypothetical protein VGI95_16120 [Caulobacteraceae bacterium]|jgi:hypothetical protein